MFAVILTLVLSVAALYFGCWTGYKAATGEPIWQHRRISKHQKQLAAKAQEKEHFAAHGIELWMRLSTDTTTRDLYKTKDWLGDTARAAGKVKEILKR